MLNNDKEHIEFEQMLGRVQGILYRVCLAFTDRQPSSIDDLHQEIVCNLWQGWPKCRNKKSPTTWVYRVAINTATFELRKQQRRSGLSSRSTSFNLINTLSDETTDARLERLYDLINQLPTNEKEIIFLYLDRLSHAQIAAVTGSTEAAVKQHIYRIKQKLITLNKQKHD